MCVYATIVQLDSIYSLNQNGMNARNLTTFHCDAANLVLIGPPWTLEELEVVRLAFFDGLITAEKLKERYEYVGGSARYLSRL